MKKKLYLKNWVITTGIAVVVVAVVALTSLVSSSIFSSLNTDNNSYVLRDLASTYIPVNTEVENKASKPYTAESVSVHTNYYDVKKEKEVQEKSLILYENTYMPNTGILYSDKEAFDVVAVYEGEVLSITEDDIFGSIIEIKHTNNITSKYSSVKDPKVSVGETVNKGEVIASSGKNKIVSETENMLLFELLYNGTNVNPDEYYDKDFNEMR